MSGDLGWILLTNFESMRCRAYVYFWVRLSLNPVEADEGLMKGPSFYGMVISGVSGGFSLVFGLYSLVYPPEAMRMMGANVGSLMPWINALLGAGVLAVIAVVGLTTSSYLVKWNSPIMVLFGFLMLLLSIFSPADLLGLSLIMMVLAGLMVASGLAITLMTNPFGRTRSCPSCGSEVVSWGKRAMTYCTSCSWYFGSIPESTSIMVSGDPGVGKTMLILRLAEVFLSRGKKCIFVGCDQPPEVTKKVVGEIHLGHLTKKISESNQDFVMVDSFSSSAGLSSDERYHTKGVFDLNEMNLIVAGLCENVDEGLALLIDSVNPLFLHKDADSVLKYLDYSRAKLLGKGRLFVFTVTEGTMGETVYRKLESVVDGVVEMKFVEEKQRRLRRLRFRKLRGNIFDEWVYFEVLPKEGIVLSPIEKQRIPA